jgi:segregation and condensation protein A
MAERPRTRGAKSERDPDSEREPDELDEPASLSPADAFRIQLPNFEGPLDLLLHLIKEHKLDIFDIPIALITEKYLEHLELMRALNLDIAGEFLLMAATLAHLKSRMLLPRVEPQAVDVDEQGTDPREELVRRLLEYQKYKAAGEQLGTQPILLRDVFPRRAVVEEAPVGEGELGLMEISVFKLIEAFDRVMKNARVEITHEVLVERTSITDAISQLADKLRESPQLLFFSLFEGRPERGQMVALFLAILEMTRLKLIKIFQEVHSGDIVIRTASGQVLDVKPEVEDEYK